MDTKMTKRRNFSDKFKAAVALEALRGDKTVQEIAANRPLHPTQVSTWKRQPIERMANVFSDKIKKAELKILMDRRGRYIDNIFIERLRQSLKHEATNLHEITDWFQAKRAIDDWIEFYNSGRPLTTLDKKTPDAAYAYQAGTRKAA